MVSHYYAATTFVDTQVGKVLNALGRLDLKQNTIAVLFGDHGNGLGERDSFFAKGNLWKRSLRTPIEDSETGARGR
ncbi:Sulfatase [Crateriforma conspicua]|uniref:Sulfatase n=2 Tax=Planctomycetaceae TaxID=126 RepID=A0A5C6FNA0_9PLAN|nr:Sulfatase [Crateriforma conspicua]